MGRLLLWIVIIIVVVAAAGAVYLMTATVPAPVHHVEQVIPNDRLGR